jgi:mono/diheme cytochrome c family protein
LVFFVDGPSRLASLLLIAAGVDSEESAVWPLSAKETIMDRPQRRVVFAGVLGAGILGVLAAGCFFNSKKPIPVAIEEDQTPVAARPRTGPEMYAANCAPCHGDKGDGQGPAARFLYPVPRDFSEAQFRLVSTTNNIPSDEDLQNVIRRGMPGSAMLAFGHLSDQDIKALVGEVRRLIRSGVEARLRQSGEDLNAAALAKTLDTVTRPGDPLPLPKQIEKPTAESIARGAALYIKIGCVACHGEKGKGDGPQEQRNNDGMLTRPRDFTLGIFKGGRDPRQLYARVLRGMPGSPMPASSGLSEQQVGDLVHFMLSLSSPEITAQVEHRRRQIVARRVSAELPKTIPASIWQSAQAVPIVVSPLWWREYVLPDLKVTAVHDGTTLAIRLSWLDSTPNQEILRTDDFEDMAAVQLYKAGKDRHEPFVGMGSSDRIIDLWLWRASWQGKGPTSDRQLDDYPFDSPNYAALKRDRDKGAPDFQTARAAGNQGTRPDGKSTASQLTARGFGSTTFRSRASQLVSATSQWKDGRWTVVLRRALQIRPEQGLTLAAGESYSSAFALWFGEARDRNGQKLVSIWHDLKIEK